MVECLKCGNRNPANFSYGSVKAKDGTFSNLNDKNPLGEVLSQLIACNCCNTLTTVEYHIVLKGYNLKKD